MDRRKPVQGWNRRVLGVAAVGLVAAALPSLAVADSRPSALLVVDRRVADDPSAGAGLRSILQELDGDWQLIDPGTLPFVAWPDPDCASDGPELAGLVREVREGLRRYYDDTDLPGAASAFSRAMDRLARSPCILAHRDEERTLAVAAGLLWVRILRQRGPSADAWRAAERLCERFSSEEIAGADVPPDEKAFVESVRNDRVGTTVPLRVRLDGGSDADGVRLLIDGIEVAASDRDGFRVIPGRRAVSVVLPDGRVLTSRSDVGSKGGEATIDLDVSVALFRVGTDVPAVGVRSEGVLRRLASRSAAVVLFLGMAEDGSSRIAAIPTGSDDGFASPSPGGLSPMAGMEVASSLPAVEARSSRRPWAWPWVTGALSAGLLSAGVSLNVLANRDADAVNAGTNRLDDFRARRAGAIACYSLAGASVAATVLLAVLRPEVKRTPSVAPVEGGVVLGLGGSF